MGDAIVAAFPICNDCELTNRRRRSNLICNVTPMAVISAHGRARERSHIRCEHDTSNEIFCGSPEVENGGFRQQHFETRGWMFTNMH